MTAASSDDSRLQKLQQMLAGQPRDPFLLYGIAMEHKKSKSFDPAIEYFDRALEVDPNYCYAYFHRGQTYEQMGRPEDAARSYREGLAAAERAGDAHARDELQAALELLG